MMEKLTDEELAAARRRFEGALRLQEIEGNPLDADDIAIFEMFDRERWPHEKCLDYIRERARNGHVPAASSEE